MAEPVRPGIGPIGNVSDYTSPVTVVALAKKTLEQLRYEEVQYFPERVVAEADWETISEKVKMMRVRLSGYALAEKLADDHYTRTKHVPFPKSPWQFFKERHQHSWWMAWLVRWRPVVYEKHRISLTVDVARYLAYPQATILSREFGTPVQHETVKVTEEVPERG